MALMLLAGAGYAWYQASQQQQAQEKYPLDPNLNNLEGKIAVEFLPLEYKIGLLSNSLTTVTFYQGDYRTIVDGLRERVEDIIAANPWLGGWLAQKPGDTEVKLWYDAQGKDVAPCIFTAFQPGDIPLKRDTKYIQYKEICADFSVKVPATSKLIGRNHPVWKVSIIPDAVEHFDRFAIIVSQSHLVGDAYTYYKIFHMLLDDISGYIVTAATSDDDNNLPKNCHPVQALNPIRHSEFRAQAEKRMGVEEASYIAKTNPDMVEQMIDNYKSSDDSHVQETLLFTVSKDWLDYQMKKCTMEEEAIRKEQLAKYAREKGLDFVPEDNIPDDAAFGGDLPVSGAPTFAEVILSWWYKTSDADIGMYPLQLRKDLEVLSDDDAGNYNIPIPYTKADYASPQLIHDSVRTGKRCATVAPSGQLTPLPRITTGKSFAIGVDWNQFCPHELQQSQKKHGSDTLKEELHIPLLTADDLLAFPSKVSCCLLFTAYKGKSMDVGVEGEGGDGNSPRIGVFVVAKKDICDRIIASGIVDEDMKSSLTKDIVNRRGSIIEFASLPDLKSLGLEIDLEDMKQLTVNANDDHDEDAQQEETQRCE